MVTLRAARHRSVDLHLDPRGPLETDNDGDVVLFPALTSLLAETERFELSVQMYPYDGLANRWFQPLTHVSGSQ
jgi:hypothetical protein